MLNKCFIETFWPAFIKLLNRLISRSHIISHIDSIGTFIPVTLFTHPSGLLSVLKGSMHTLSVCWIFSPFFAFDTIRSGISSFALLLAWFPVHAYRFTLDGLRVTCILEGTAYRDIVGSLFTSEDASQADVNNRIIRIG